MPGEGVVRLLIEVGASRPDGLMARSMSRMSARALFHTAPRCVEIRELATPRPAAGEFLVRTLCSGISGGTERLVYRGEVPADLALDDTIAAMGGTFSYPFAYGYACVGRVADSGQTVFAFHPHQDIFAARASDLIALPAIEPASATRSAATAERSAARARRRRAR